jgi:hypothetical protein
MEQFLLATARASSTNSSTANARRSRTRYAAASVAAAAVVAGAVVGIVHATGSSSHTPTANPSNNPTIGQNGGVHIHLAAFSVDTNPGGTVTLTLTGGQLFNPDSLRQALAKAGVPAVVTVGSVCTLPGHPSNALPQIITRSPASNGRSSTTITPSAIPAGEKLSFGFFVAPVNGAGGLFISLVPDNAALTCTTTPPAPPHRR